MYSTAKNACTRSTHALRNTEEYCMIWEHVLVDGTSQKDPCRALEWRGLQVSKLEIGLQIDPSA